MKITSFEKEEKIIISIIGLLALISFFLDQFIINLIYDIRNVFFDYLLSPFSLNLSLFMPLLLITTFYLYVKNKKEGIMPLWTSFIITYIIIYIIKFIVQRPRMLTEMFTVFHLPDYSFPSAHAALSFAILAVVDEEFRKLNFFWLIIALLIIFSRLYFSYHYFSDICFGALIGYGIGIVVIRTYTKK